MPSTAAQSTSQRLLSLLSLLQARRDWPGGLLAERLEVSERTVRRDIDRLRDLGYPIRAIRGPDGGYQLSAGSHLPPLLFDDEQAVALAVALRTAAGAGAGIEDAAIRALTTVRQVMPSHLRARIDSLEAITAQAGSHGHDQQTDPEVLAAVSDAIRAHQELRFDYQPVTPTPDDSPIRPARRVQPHHLIARAGRWYLIAWRPDHADWRIYRADRINPHTPTGPRFNPQEIPGGDASTFLAARFKGSESSDAWPCIGEVILDRPAAEIIAFAGDGTVLPLAPDRCRLRTGSWSWPALAATLTRFDADITVLEPDRLRDAFADLARRATQAAKPDDISSIPQTTSNTPPIHP